MHLVEGLGKCTEVTVVHPAGVDLPCELGERGRPRRPGRRHRDLNPFDDLDHLLYFDETVDYLNGGESGFRCASLVPGALPK